MPSPKRRCLACPLLPRGGYSMHQTVAESQVGGFQTGQMHCDARYHCLYVTRDSPVQASLSRRGLSGKRRTSDTRSVTGLPGQRIRRVARGENKQAKVKGKGGPLSNKQRALLKALLSRAPCRACLLDKTRKVTDEQVKKPGREAQTVQKTARACKIPSTPIS